MSVLYHLMIPQLKMPTLDAVVQEVEALRSHPGDEIVYLNPARLPGSRYPERLYGLHRLPYLRQREATVQLHHVFNPRLLFFPYLRWLRRPIIYSVTAGVRSSERPGNLTKLRRLSAIVVSNDRDQALLNSWGLENVHAIHPGINTARFDSMPPPEAPGLTLLAGSAPWTKAQFRTKGVEALLEAAETRPDLRLVLLWRGLLFEEIQAQVIERGLNTRVTVINHHADINEVLAGVHAAVVLATDATLVRAFPHSLLEALAAGRPVLISPVLPMADYVRRTGCGQVVETVSPEGVLTALARLEASYTACRAMALEVGQRDFSQQAFTEAYQRLYSEHGRVPFGPVK